MVPLAALSPSPSRCHFERRVGRTACALWANAILSPGDEDLACRCSSMRKMLRPRASHELIQMGTHAPDAGAKRRSRPSRVSASASGNGEICRVRALLASELKPPLASVLHTARRPLLCVCRYDSMPLKHR